ncbi:alpha/beta fold hydrolase [Frigoribacterium faeni]|uniref:alpha/beta fold hydrolase n=1 Tax=Frigoribacterium TaxID=96492 RepID=UPI001FAD2A91|nr:alpha/beta fold hydrolase [Frigoribacterium faeni]MCJ0699633.1 alpha/beta hydrolase [Frigoribacterium faeni]
MIVREPRVPSPYRSRLAAFDVEERVAEVAGSSTRYWTYEPVGPEEARVTVVAVHGFRGDHHGLEPVVAHLTGVRVIMPDLPGFGESSPLASEHSVEAYAAWLTAFVESIGLGDDVVVLGHSFGSIVTSAAVASGLRASRLVLVNPIAAPALQGPRGVVTRLAVFYYWAGAALPERSGLAALQSPLVTRFTSLAMVKTHDRGLRRWIHDQHDSYFSRFSDRRVVLDAFRASVSSDVSTYAAGVDVPTLLVAADRDDITALPAQHELRALFPDATLAVIDGVGHLIHYEKPREAAAAVEAFVR